MDSDRIYQEAELIYRKAPGFKPVNGDLKNWVGEIKFKQKNGFSNCLINILLPEGYPSTPPIVSCTPILKHPVIDAATGRFNLELLKHWNPGTHVYEIVNVIKDEFNRRPPEILGALKPIIKPSLNTVQDLELKIKELEREVELLRRDLAEKNEELNRLQAFLTRKNIDKTLTEVNPVIVSDTDPLTDLEGEKIALEGLIRDLEARFDSGDISPEEYSKLSKKYRKQLYLVEKKLSTGFEDGSKRS